MPTISHWPTRKDGKNATKVPPAHVHEQATRPSRERGLRLMDPDNEKPGPCRWLMRDGRPVPADKQYENPRKRPSS